jgi:hypothetical protein
MTLAKVLESPNLESANLESAGVESAGLESQEFMTAPLRITAL